MRKINVLASLGLLTVALAAPAEHAEIALRLARLDPATGQTMGEIVAAADEEPPAGGVKARPQFRAKPGEPLQVQFFFTNTYPHDVLKDVRIRYFVARIDKVGQKTLPDLEKGTVVQGQFQTNFKPKSRVGARAAFTVHEPGVYLLRVDSANTKSDHEHIAGIDLIIE